ncbi:DUF1657 domain-containing protein [Alkalihalobacillus trypoxylicola]|uniref:DUF1657 domain-containing protein n=1 Tax=Alkalihalobacillus trypoxylicola TaxID=519424 RepID=A0A161PHS7_9BACI|nr:DUF1657 domain-containing protein [Alkalihalobacillus trypoxylicola]KYG33165.1 hypothetical protein AZF04_17630 [Alkalihalobacillus trypoxylicola]GAF65366.1 hypothetical protein BTS2_2264 [Bacillus sp. TS-2]
MTVSSQVKGTLASLKGIEATLQTLSLQAEAMEQRDRFHQASLKTKTVITQIEKRVSEIEKQEPQYQGN